MMKKIYSNRHSFKYDYYISENAEVYSSISQKWLNPVTDKDGYLRIRLINAEGVLKALPIHRIMMMTYNPVSNMDALEVNHKDGDKTNNLLNNLEWVSTKENIRHAHRTGLSNSIGERNPGHKLVEKEVYEIIDLIQHTKYTYSEISVFYGVHEETIGRIKRKKSWKHLTQNIIFNQRSTTSRKA